MKAYYSLSEVCAIMEVTNRTARKWFTSGDLKGFKVPHSAVRYRILRADFIDFLKRHDIYNYVVRYHPELIEPATRDATSKDGF